jgi:hypothetical protein
MKNFYKSAIYSRLSSTISIWHCLLLGKCSLLLYRIIFFRVDPKIMVLSCVIVRLMGDDTYQLAAANPNVVFHPDVEIQLCDQPFPCQSVVRAAQSHNSINRHPIDCIKYLPFNPNPDNGNPAA